MCDSHVHRDVGGHPRLSRAVKIQWVLLALFAGVALLAGVLGLGHGNKRVSTAMLAGDRVFATDLARQAADAGQLVRRAAGTGGLSMLARTIQREDRRALGSTPIAPASLPVSKGLPPAGSLRHALLLHVNEDRIIARVALASAPSARARRAAARLLRSSRPWIRASAQLSPP